MLFLAHVPINVYPQRVLSLKMDYQKTLFHLRMYTADISIHKVARKTAQKYRLGGVYQAFLLDVP